MNEDLLERAVNAYHAEYHRHWRDGGDAQDHDEAHRCGIEAVYVEVAREIARWVRHIDRLDEIPGARVGLPKFNPLWDAGGAIEAEFAPHYDPITGRRREENAS